VPAAESVTHHTHWRLEKREGSLEDFILERRREALEVLDGHRPYHDIDVPALRREIEIIEEWLADPRTGDDVRALWTRERVVDAALHRIFMGSVRPAEVIEREGNILVTAGIGVLLSLLRGDTGVTPFNNTNAHLGVGDSTSGTAVGQTDLQAPTNRLRRPMNATYPQISAPNIQFQSTFGSGDANFSWNEIGTFNASSGGTMLNRVVQALGTKIAGSAWSLTETIAWS
jgi:hypothetical protein